LTNKLAQNKCTKTNTDNSCIPIPVLSMKVQQSTYMVYDLTLSVSDTVRREY